MHGDPFVPRVGLAHSNDVCVNLNQIKIFPPKQYLIMSKMFEKRNRQTHAGAI